MGRLTLTQRLCLVLGVVFLLQSIGGLIANPDFSTGDDASADVFLWMDWNGWHALSGILLWATALAAFPNPRHARMFAWLVIITNVPVIVWMALGDTPFALFHLPTTRDLVFHTAI